MKYEHLVLVFVEDVGGEGAVGAEPLAVEDLCEAGFFFGDVADVVSLRVENHVFVGLFETEEDVAELELPLDDDGGVAED